MCQFLQMHKARVGDLGVVEVKHLQVRQPLQMNKIRVGDFAAAERKPFQLRQHFQMNKIRVGDLSVVESNPTDISITIFFNLCTEFLKGSDSFLHKVQWGTTLWTCRSSF